MIWKCLHENRTLDDMEMYEQRRMFTLEDYIKMSKFLNLFVYKVTWNNLIGKAIFHTFMHFFVCAVDANNMHVPKYVLF